MKPQAARRAGLAVGDAQAIAATVASYTLDNRPTVDYWLPQVREARIRDTIAHLSSYQNRYFAGPAGKASAEWIHDHWAALAAGRSDVTTSSLAGEPIEDLMSHAPRNGAALGGIKVTTGSGWFAARPSGTEDLYKIYAESFRGADHLATLQEEAKALVAHAFEGSGAAPAGGEG